MFIYSEIYTILWFRGAATSTQGTHVRTCVRSWKKKWKNIQLFLGGLSDKVYATIPKGSLFFKEIWTNGKGGDGDMSVSAKGEQQK